MPRRPSTRRVVQVRFERDVVNRLHSLAEAEGWLHFHGVELGSAPSISEAARRLVDEALAARDGDGVPASADPGHAGSHAVTVAPGGLAWIDAEAEREGVDRDAMVRTLLREASQARQGVSRP